MLSKQPVSNQCCRTAHLASLPGAEVSVMLSLSHASRHRFYQPCCSSPSSVPPLSAFASVSCFLPLHQFRAFCVCTSFVLSAFVSVSCFLPLHQFCAFCLCISFVLSAFVSVSFSLRLHQFRSPCFQLLSRWVSKAVMSSVSCTCYIYLSTVGVFRVALVRAVKLMLLSYAFQILA